jgi:hypothetical protein
MLIVLQGQMAKMMHVVTKKSPLDWTSEERMFVFLNRYAYITECLRLFEIEKEDRKLLKFIKSKETIKMPTELDDKIIQLHDIARAVEKEIGVGQLSEDIRKAADRLSELLK